MSRPKLALIALSVPLILFGGYYWWQTSLSSSVANDSTEDRSGHRGTNAVAPTDVVDVPRAEPPATTMELATSRIERATRLAQDAREAEAPPPKAPDPKTLRNQRREEIRKASIGLVEQLALTGQEYEQLLDLMTRHSLEHADRIGHQLGSIVAAPAEPTEAQREQLIALLGEGRTAAYLHYLETLPIRTQVRQFGVELGESNALTDSQANRLVEVIASQREKHMRQVKARYAGMQIDFGMGMWYGAAFMTSSDQGTSRQEQLATQMNDYNDHLAEAASTVLSESQLEVFRWAQQDRASSMMTRIQEMERQIGMANAAAN